MQLTARYSKRELLEIYINLAPYGSNIEGVGAVRQALVRADRVPVLLVHAGPRPGGLAPRESRTRFSWTVEA